ncbi:MAG TPA: HAD-IA family hydrolase [Dehalococcoidia bacterium]
MITGVRALIFDFDLTLADSSPGFDDCHRFAAGRLGLALPDHESVRRTIGTQLPLAVPLLYGAAIDGRLDEYVRLYQARADEVMTGLTVMLPGASDAVHRLHNAGLPLAIVSQKLRYRVEDVLRREALLDCFAAVLGAEDVPAFKPDPSGLLLALQRLDVPVPDALYVGDTTIDAEAAANAGLRFVAVLTGPTTAADFAPHHPLSVLDSVVDLPALLDAR